MNDELITEAVRAADGEHDARPVDELLVDELLIEEISIDGMCGVY